MGIAAFFMVVVPSGLTLPRFHRKPPDEAMRRSRGYPARRDRDMRGCWSGRPGKTDALNLPASSRVVIDREIPRRYAERIPGHVGARHRLSAQAIARSSPGGPPCGGTTKTAG